MRDCRCFGSGSAHAESVCARLYRARGGNGGNPFVCAAVSEVFDIFKDDHIVGHAQEIGQYLWDQLEVLKDKYNCIVDHRGVGLIQGLEFKDNPSEIVKRALENGLVIIAAGNNTIRFVPPLVVSNADVDKMISILEKVIK